MFRRRSPILMTLAVAGIAAALFFHYPNAPPRCITLVVKNAMDPRWSRDGTALMYRIPRNRRDYEGPTSFYRRDLKTGHMQVLRIPEYADAADYSPDGWSMCCLLYDGANFTHIGVGRLKSGTRTILSAAGLIGPPRWMMNDKIGISQESLPNRPQGFYVISPGTKNPARVLNTHLVMDVDRKGQHLLWRDEKAHFYTFDLRTKKTVRIRDGLITTTNPGYIAYYSDDVVLLPNSDMGYGLGHSKNLPSYKYPTFHNDDGLVRVNLKKMASRVDSAQRILGHSAMDYFRKHDILPYAIMFSPDLSKCIVYDQGSQGGSSRWFWGTPSWLFVIDIDPKIAEELRRN